jgi:type III restriction enzyme
VAGVEYFAVAGKTYEMRRFQADDLMEVFESNVVAVKRPEKTLTSHIVVDSGSTPEKEFALACENNDDVHFYIKLPHWFRIETPVGGYTPDWALVYHNERSIYFVAETKNTGGNAVKMDLLRPLEALKIQCGRKHFDEFEDVRFRVVKSLDELVS